ncbi:MAG TPA: hypothetical protein VFV67_31035 [Actinophytocola sp.]|uniref:hypothetical protein n=1 Tax=Actinophytocola sp. TaxID=1872138 RepID=UPI002DB7C65A|nr:hypothetical protein [Actinophytocola sp.]HEU5475102.1 hypothetical protein [Actinophytocola sp.]
MSAADARGYLLDTTALAALGTSRRMSTLITAAPRLGRPLYAPATCVDAADRIRPGIAAHVGRIPAVETLDLTYAQVLEIRESTPRLPLDVAHVISLALPNATWPKGLIVATVLPDRYAGFDLTLFAVGD